MLLRVKAVFKVKLSNEIVVGREDTRGGRCQSTVAGLGTEERNVLVFQRA